ncbi:hypothetical protein SNE40_000617 [Patella caerulea]|uniref:Uncharacterized protein n=1 Tax=Patella caerulea TaxID=87958 RepID=A0AAN8Q1R6_PATCE
MPLLQLSAIPAREITNATVELCSKQCVQETEFECKSFDFDNSFKKCYLHNHTHEDAFAILQTAHYTDHYRSAFEKLFNRLPSHVLTVHHNRNIPSVSPEECARRCIFEMTFKCRGFDYELKVRNCWLTEQTPVDTNGVQVHHGADYYQRTLDGPISKFICYGVGSLPQIDGYQIYGKVMIGVTLEACAQLCLSQTLFKCVSFDYSFNSKTCQMSKYIAANLLGLETDIIPTYKVMHYERMEEFLEYFYPTPYTVVLGNNEKTYRRVTPNRCARVCLEERDLICRSFDYQIEEGTCFLSSKTGSDVGGLYYQGLTQVHHFEMKPFLDCGGIITGESGNFASPNWPRNYPHNLNCSWYLQAPSFKVIHFDFSHLDLGRHTSNTCDEANDRLLIIERTPHGLVRFCASQTMNNYVSQTSNVTLQFLTNMNNDAPGFRVFYNTDWPCHAMLTEDDGEIASPGWPDLYAPGLSCVWTIAAPSEAKIFIHFTHIHLEGQSLRQCGDGYDILEVFDGDSLAAEKIGTFCGNEQSQSFTSRYNVLLVRFNTDQHGQNTGFHATYKFLYKQTTTVPTTTVQFPTALNSSLHKALTAMFFEPGRNEEDDHSVKTSVPYSVHSTTVHNTMGKDGGAITGQKWNNEAIIIHMRTILALFIPLIILLVITITALILICRYYRRRLPKRRNVPNYTFTEENLSLYEKDNIDNTNNEEETCRIECANPDISFSNPLYERRFPKEKEEEEKIEVEDIPC